MLWQYHGVLSPLLNIKLYFFGMFDFTIGFLRFSFVIPGFPYDDVISCSMVYIQHSGNTVTLNPTKHFVNTSKTLRKFFGHRVNTPRFWPTRSKHAGKFRPSVSLREAVMEHCRRMCIRTYRNNEQRQLGCGYSCYFPIYYEHTVRYLVLLLCTPRYPTRSDHR